MSLFYRSNSTIRIILSVFWLVYIVLYSNSSLYAQTWTGNGGDIFWGNPANWSTNSVPTSSGSVTINDAIVVISDQYVVQDLTLVEATLTINVQSGLRISGSNATALSMDDESFVIVDGLLRVQNYQSNGISLTLNSTLNVGASGILRIEANGNTGVDLQSGAFNNSGNVLIEDASVAIVNFGQITNEGTFLIDNVQSIGINHRDGNIKNCSGGHFAISGDVTASPAAIGIDTRSTVTNEGTFEVESCYEDALRIRQGTLINKDSLIFRDFSFGLSGGITSGSSLIQNDAEAVILFETSSDDHISVAIATQGTVINYGLIKMIDRTDIGISMARGAMTPSEEATATFNNYGRIECLEHAASLFINNNAIFHNHVNGEIIIGPIGDPNHAISNDASFTNDGLIDINWPITSESCISSYSEPGIAHFTNRGLIKTVGGSVGIRTTGSAESKSLFINDETGIIDIKQAQRGINLSDTFINKNIIIIDGCTDYGIIVTGSETFNSVLENMDSISILNCYRSILVGGKLQNSKFLSVQNGTNEGLNISQAGTFQSDPLSFACIESVIPIIIDSEGSVLDIQGEFIVRLPD